MVYNNELQKADFIKDTGCYNHYAYQIHHFIRKSVRKNSPEFYARIEHLQKLIYMPEWLHKELHDMAFSDEQFEKTAHISRWDLIFNKKHSKY